MEILNIYFLETIIRRKYMQKISDVEHFCNDKFEETPKQKVIDFTLGYLSKPAPNPNVY